MKALVLLVAGGLQQACGPSCLDFLWNPSFGLVLHVDLLVCDPLRFFTWETKLRLVLVLPMHSCRRDFWCCAPTKTRATAFLVFCDVFLQDASSRFDAADISKVHHLGFIDLTKFGRLAAPEINDVAQWTHQLLSQNPDYSLLALFQHVMFELFGLGMVWCFCCLYGFIILCFLWSWLYWCERLLKAWWSFVAPFLLEMVWWMVFEVNTGNSWRPNKNLCLTRLFLPSKKNIDEFCFQGASKTSWTASRWQRKWCRSCSTQAVCREIGCFSTSYRFCFCVGLIGVLGFFPWKGGRVCKADQGRSQSSYQHGLLSWTLRWEVGRTLCTRHLGTLNVNCQMTTFGQSQTIGIFWRTHLQFHCQWVACFTLIVIFCFLFCFVLPKRCFKVCSLFDKLRRVCNSWEWNLLHTWARPISDRFTSLSYNIFVFFLQLLSANDTHELEHLKSPYQ